ncbi:uncharacterized protein TrAtP1_002604 [Trichoderma atroviride]|uniref:uncharacterized protein n=1 Tax=Hypocrea atroviridis TaxID=63577 RepID=UPI003328D220|nr:hypothetical protein TrAtP1_002604 [Trichoderma atroviride]
MTARSVNNEFEIVLEDKTNPDDISAKPKFTIRGANIDNGGDSTGLIDVNIGGDALIVQCDLVQAVHGFLYSDQPATLAVFQFGFVPRGNNRRFKEVKVTLTFSAGDVKAITPSNTWAIFKSKTEREVSHSVNPNLEASCGPGKGSLGYTWQLKKTDKIKGHARVEGIMRTQGHSSRRGGRKNTVFWGLYENKAIKSGIPSFMQTAVLLKRDKLVEDPLGERFSAKIMISGEVDRLTNVKEKWETLTAAMSGSSVKGENILFNPKNNRGTVKDPGNLLVKDLEKYKSLVTIRNWVDENAELTLKTGAVVAVPATTSMAVADKPALGPVDQTKLSAEAATGALSLIPPVQSTTMIHQPAAEDLDSHAQVQEPAPAGVSIPVVESAATNEMDPSAEKSEVVETSGGERVAEILVELRDQLSTVRIKANLVRRLLQLEEKERHIMQEIMRLESLPTD